MPWHPSHGAYFAARRSSYQLHMCADLRYGDESRPPELLGSSLFASFGSDWHPGRAKQYAWGSAALGGVEASS